MHNCKCIQLPINIIQQEIVDVPKLNDTVTEDGCVHVETHHGMCGLKQAGHIVND